MCLFFFYRTSEKVQPKIEFIMVQYWYCFSKELSVLFTAVSISLASTSSPSSFLISMTEKIARKCVVKYNSWRYDYYLYFDFHNKLNLNSSQWEFAIETCDSTFDNYFCLNWEVEERSSVCKITNISNRVLCIMRRIDPEIEHWIHIDISFMLSSIQRIL